MITYGGKAVSLVQKTIAWMHELLVLAIDDLIVLNHVCHVILFVWQRTVSETFLVHLQTFASISARIAWKYTASTQSVCVRVTEFRDEFIYVDDL